MIRSGSWRWALVALLGIALAILFILRASKRPELAATYRQLGPRWGERADACKLDADCVLSNERDGECCGIACG
ncbi:MAG TPA: hypothetical protein VHB79_37845 [Polyangiaceae bacterium]|nr:hypothetical protein [Polyangiaceae bacterium]